VKHDDLAVIHDVLRRYDPEVVLLELARISREAGIDSRRGFVVANLVRELAIADSPGTRVPARRVLTELLDKLFRVPDVGLLKQMGGSIRETFLSRMLAEQVLTQRDVRRDLIRSLKCLPQSFDWTEVLGIPLPRWWVAVEMFVAVLSYNESIDLASYRAASQGAENVVDDMIHVASRLASTYREMVVTTSKRLELSPAEDRTRLASPLLTTPLVRLRSGRLAAPSIQHVRLAASPAAFHLAAIRKGWASDVGDNFANYLAEYAEVALSPSGWRVVRVDSTICSSSIGKRADLVLVSPGSHAVVIVEAKTALQKEATRLGDPTLRDEQASQYQQWFDQICATRPRLSDLGVALRAGCQVVGLAVTFEPHLVTTVGERTYGSLVLPHPEPQAKYATGQSDVRCRVLPAAQFELLIDVAPGLDSDRIRQLINLVFEYPTPALSVTKAAAEMQLRPILHPFVPETVNNLVGHVIDHIGGPRSEELRKQFENM
jgi:hypothetical protein